MNSIDSPRISPCRLRSMLLASLVIVLVALPISLARAASGTIWSIVPSPNPSISPISNDALFGVSAISDRDVWSAGAFSSSSGNNINHTLVEHWNGKAWSIVPSPDSGTQGSQLLGIAALSDSNVWAVGNFSTSNTSLGNRTLIEHFNGASWSVIPSPNPSQEGDNLTAVTAIASNNVWAVGYFENNLESDILPLVEHFNGSVWSVVTAGVPTTGAIFVNGITAISSTDIWAVGESGNGPTNFEMHWNGTKWSVATSATFPSNGQESLGDVAGASGKDVWAVGSYSPSFGAELQTLVVHWNGSTWSKVTTPNVDKFFNLLFGVAVVRSNDVWAVGYAYTPDGLSFSTLTERWDGAKWTIVPSPTTPASEVRGVAAGGPTSLWTTGTFDSFQKGNPGIRTLTMHTNQG